MGTRESIPEQKPQIPEQLGQGEVSNPIISSRNPRQNYLNKMGFGDGTSPSPRVMAVRDFKVPKWMEGYQVQQRQRALNEAEEEKSANHSERITSNEVFDLSFIQAKTNDDIRKGLLMKMSNAGIWLPPSQRKPRSQSIIIFDWDDTLLCTSYLNSRDDAINIQSKSILAQLKTLEDCVCRLLSLATSLGNTYIITNAMKGWVEYSSGLWVSGVQSFLDEITVISARSEYEHKYPGNYHQWKVEAFLEMTKLFDTGTVTNLICLGDSNIEIDAAHTLAKCYQNACIKTIKFRDCPSPEELVKQLELVIEKFEKICTTGRNLTIRLER